MKSIIQIVTVAIVISGSLMVSKPLGAALSITTVSRFHQENKKSLIYYRDKSCGHCKDFNAKFVSLVKYLKKRSPDFQVGHMNLKEEVSGREYLESFTGAKDVPTVLFHLGAKDKFVTYTGEKILDYLIPWVGSNIGQTYVELSSKDGLKFEKLYLDSFVVYQGEKSGSSWETFIELSKEFSRMQFVYLSPEVQVPGLTSQGFALFLKSKKWKPLVYQGDIDSTKVREFIQFNRYEPVSKFNRQVIQRMFREDTPGIVFLTDEKNHKFIDVMKTLSAKVQRKFDLVFSVCPILEGLGTQMTQYIGYVPEDSDLFILHHDKGYLHKYLMKDELTYENAFKFIQDFQDGNLKEFYISDPEPETNDEVVKVVVGNSFERLVLDNDKFVFVMFHSEGCNHCRDFMPSFESLATTFLKKTSSIVFAKMDSSSNDNPIVKVNRYPMLYLFAPNQKRSPILFDGSRDKAKVEEWLDQKLGLAEDQEETGGDL